MRLAELLFPVRWDRLAAALWNLISLIFKSNKAPTGTREQANRKAAHGRFHQLFVSLANFSSILGDEIFAFPFQSSR